MSEIMGLTAEKIEEDILNSINIPPQPGILIEVQNEMKKESPSIDYISNKVREDVSLSSNILKQVNSPYYGLRTEIDSIKHAISLLGMEHIATVISCLFFKQQMNDSGVIPMPRYWDHSVDVAKLSSYLAKELRISKPSEAYALGMFKDAGIPILAQRFENYKAVLSQQNMSEYQSFTELEDKHFNTNHCVVGYMMTKRWGLSKTTREACLYHHNIEYMTDLSNVEDHESRKLIFLAKIANHVANYKRDEPQHEWKLLQDFILDYLCLSELDFFDLREEMLDHLAGV